MEYQIYKVFSLCVKDQSFQGKSCYEYLKTTINLKHICIEVFKEQKYAPQLLDFKQGNEWILKMRKQNLRVQQKLKNTYLFDQMNSWFRCYFEVCFLGFHQEKVFFLFFLLEQKYTLFFLISFRCYISEVTQRLLNHISSSLHMVGTFGGNWMKRNVCAFVLVGWQEA